MRNVLLTFALLLCFAFSADAQIKVITSGFTGVGESTPVEQLHVGGNIALSSPETGGTNQYNRNHLVYGIGGKKRLQFSSNSSSSNSWAWINMFGDETCAACPNTTKRGWIDMGAQRFVLRTNNDNLGFGTIALTVETNSDAFFTGDVYSMGNLVSSDKRLKRDISNFDLGLKEVLNINPKKYYYNGEGGIKSVNRQHVGVIAQEFKEIVPEGVKEYTFEDDLNDVKKQNYLAVDEGMIKFMLINAVKEQQELIEAQNERIAEMEAMIINLANGTTTQSVEVKDSRLGQNAPNPFNQSTIISYTVPTKSNTAVLQIFDMNGQMLKAVNVANGNGQLTINAGELAAGTYSYNLVVDGAIVDTKKMVLTK